MVRLPLAAVTCGAALAAGAVAPAPPAAAAGSPAAGVPFSVTPVGRPALRFAVRPGAAVSGRVRVQNLGSRSRTIRLVASDLVTADTGGPSFPARTPARVGTWLTMRHTLVRLPPGGGRTVGFRARMPSGARAGQHYAGIVAVDAGEAAAARKPVKGARGVRVRHLTRLALPVRLTAPGRLVTRVAVTRLGFGVDATGSSLRIGLRNVGTRIARTTAIDLRVQRAGRRVLVVDEHLADFIPSSSVSFPAAWRGRLARGTYRVTGTIRPRGGPTVRVDRRVTFGAAQARRLERRTGVPAAIDAARPAPPARPVWLWVVVGGLLTVVAGMAGAYVRLRRSVAAG